MQRQTHNRLSLPTILALLALPAVALATSGCTTSAGAMSSGPRYVSPPPVTYVSQPRPQLAPVVEPAAQPRTDVEFEQTELIYADESEAAPPAEVGPTFNPDAPQPQDIVMLSPEQLRDVVGPIALYPDPLLAQVLAAATYPLEVVQAARFVRANGDDPAFEQTVAAQPWDPSVQALAHYPSVLYMLDENLEWTQSLGAAFLYQQQDVMDAVQWCRQQAQQAGNLATTEQQKVVVQERIIEIVPADPQVIYVPQYEPEVVYVEHHYVHPRPVISFGIGFAVGSWLHLDCDWRHRHVYHGGWYHEHHHHHHKSVHVHGHGYHDRDHHGRVGSPWRHDRHKSGPVIRHARDHGGRNDHAHRGDHDQGDRRDGGRPYFRPAPRYDQPGELPRGPQIGGRPSLTDRHDGPQPAARADDDRSRARARLDDLRDPREMRDARSERTTPGDDITRPRIVRPTPADRPAPSPATSRTPDRPTLGPAPPSSRPVQTLPRSTRPIGPTTTSPASPVPQRAAEGPSPSVRREAPTTRPQAALPSSRPAQTLPRSTRPIGPTVTSPASPAPQRAAEGPVPSVRREAPTTRPQAAPPPATRSIGPAPDRSTTPTRIDRPQPRASSSSRFSRPEPRTTPAPRVVQPSPRPAPTVRPSPSPSPVASPRPSSIAGSSRHAAPAPSNVRIAPRPQPQPSRATSSRDRSIAERNAPIRIAAPRTTSSASRASVSQPSPTVRRPEPARSSSSQSSAGPQQRSQSRSSSSSQRSESRSRGSSSRESSRQK